MDKDKDKNISINKNQTKSKKNTKAETRPENKYQKYFKRVAYKADIVDFSMRTTIKMIISDLKIYQHDKDKKHLDKMIVDIRRLNRDFALTVPLDRKNHNHRFQRHKTGAIQEAFSDYTNAQMTLALDTEASHNMFTGSIMNAVNVLTEALYKYF